MIAIYTVSFKSMIKVTFPIYMDTIDINKWYLDDTFDLLGCRFRNFKSESKVINILMNWGCVGSSCNQTFIASVLDLWIMWLDLGVLTMFGYLLPILNASELYLSITFFTLYLHFWPFGFPSTGSGHGLFSHSFICATIICCASSQSIDNVLCKNIERWVNQYWIDIIQL